MVDLDIKSLRQRHELSIEILDAIEYYRMNIKKRRQLMIMFDMGIIKDRNSHDIEIFKKCITRLMERYNKLNNYETSNSIPNTCNTIIR